jgi:hypothetical protein
MTTPYALVGMSDADDAEIINIENGCRDFPGMTRAFAVE